MPIAGFARNKFATATDRRRLAGLATTFEERASELTSAPQTIIHGEYYPKNILVREGEIFPVDWESAAVAAGEIDLASLTEGWPEEDKRVCQAEYCAARWPNGAPA